jgi:hypothetical protein
MGLEDSAQPGAMVKMTVTVASTSWAPGCTVVGVGAGAFLTTGAGVLAAAGGKTLPDEGSRLTD